MESFCNRRLALPLLGVFGWLVIGCASGTSQYNHAAQIQGVLDKYGKRAYRCAPKQLAIAESQLLFARIELKQGSFLRADEHLRLARVHANSLQEIIDRRAAEGDPCEEVFKPVAESDIDNDGIIDKLDACPNEPEDVDGFQDEEGCPDPDNDADGVCDPWVAQQRLVAKYAAVCKGVDSCPNDPEDIDGDRDEDGCPDLDNDRDGDGIVDRLDKCPDDPEDKDAFEDEDGCPDPDNDADGICDPWVAAAGQGQAGGEQGASAEPGQGEQGQPAPSPGKYASLCTGTDKCPLQPEDKDGFQDEDGCPDPDNDNDGIPDISDKCPDQAEDYDGDADDDGCPDLYKLVVVTDTRIELKQMVFFATDKTVILPRSYPLLNEVAQVLIDRPTIKVRIEGHTDSRGSDSHNLKLSQGRADSVRAYLMRQGIDSSRMESVGYGETRPIEDNSTADGRAANRRVEFHIVSQ